MPIQSHNPLVDAFGRSRTSDPESLFASHLYYNLAPLLWEDVTNGAGAVAHDSSNTRAQLSTTNSGDWAFRQTRQYHPYQPGKSQFIKITGVFGAAQSGVIKRAGYFDDNNGFWIEQDGDNGYGFGIRSSVTGSPVDTIVRKDDGEWNIGKLPYSDEEAIFIAIFDMEWLGHGTVRCGVFYGGSPYWCHHFNHAGLTDTVYMQLPSLPLRYEIRQSGSTAGTMYATCNSVDSEGGFDKSTGYPFSASNGVTTIGVTTRRPVLVIRPRATFDGKTTRSLITPEDFGFYAGSNPGHFEVVYDPVLWRSTGSALVWTAANASSTVEYCINADSTSGGISILQGSVGAAGVPNRSGGAGFAPLTTQLPLTLDYAGTTAKTLAVVVTSFTGTCDASASINWREVY